MIKIIANGFGVLSTLCFIFSFQVKSNKGLFIIQSIANVFYCTQFYLLGAYGGLFNMGLQIIRNMLLLKINDWKWLHSFVWPAVFCAMSFAYMLITWKSWMDIIPFIAFSVSTLAFWTNSAKMLRLSERFCVAPAWPLYDFLNGAYGGVLNELVILASVVVSIVRFGWKGLDDPEFQK